MVSRQVIGHFKLGVRRASSFVRSGGEIMYAGACRARSLRGEIAQHRTRFARQRYQHPLCAARLETSAPALVVKNISNIRVLGAAAAPGIMAEIILKAYRSGENLNIRGALLRMYICRNSSGVANVFSPAIALGGAHRWGINGEVATVSSAARLLLSLVRPAMPWRWPLIVKKASGVAGPSSARDEINIYSFTITAHCCVLRAPRLIIMLSKRGGVSKSSGASAAYWLWHGRPSCHGGEGRCGASRRGAGRQ